MSLRSSVDAVVVLGGGVREGGVIPDWVKARFDLALQLRHTEPILCCSAGTVHKAVLLDENGFPIFESVAGAEYLFRRGVPPSDIMVETTSWDTIGNAYYSRLLFADPLEWNSALIITSEFHMPRTQALFEWVYGMAPRNCALQFAASPDLGLDGEDLQERQTREARSLASFHCSAESSIPTLGELTKWLNRGHAAYAPDRRERLAKTVTRQALKSY